MGQRYASQHPRDELYQNLPEPLSQDQSIADYIDAWFIQRFLGVTGQWNANDVTAPNQLRATFPRRRGGMGFTTLNDVIPGAFAATVLECLFPRGLTDHGTPQDGGVSLRTSSTVFNRMMPYWSENDRRRDAPADATQRL